TTINHRPSSHTEMPERRTPNTGRRTAVGWVHAGRLRAAERELLSLLETIRQIGQEGKNPSGPGPAYTPLPAESWARLAATLDDLAACARRVGELAGPSPDADRVQGPAATRAALSARLGQMESHVQDLRPESLQGRYGTLP